MSRNADAPQIYRKGSSPNTRVAISQKNRVFSKPYTTGAPTQKQVGVLATFDYTETRPVDPVRGVGFGDRVVELVPGVTEPMGLTLNRTLMYTAGIIQELGYRGGIDGLVRSLRQHKWPFDIKSELVFSELATSDRGTWAVPGGPLLASDLSGNYALITYFEGCWINSYSVSFPGDSAIVLEDCSVTATDVTDGVHVYGDSPDAYGDLLDSGNNPILKPGSGSDIFRGLFGA
jgi:hypothetical protein